MNEKRSAALARGRGSRCNRRELMRAFGAATLVVVGAATLPDVTSANPAPSRRTSTEDRLLTAMVDISHDTQRVAGLGLAAAAILVAGKLIRDKERDSEL